MAVPIITATPGRPNQASAKMEMTTAQTDAVGEADAELFY